MGIDKVSACLAFMLMSTFLLAAQPPRLLCEKASYSSTQLKEKITTQKTKKNYLLALLNMQKYTHKLACIFMAAYSPQLFTFVAHKLCCLMRPLSIARMHTSPSLRQLNITTAGALSIPSLPVHILAPILHSPEASRERIIALGKKLLVPSPTITKFIATLESPEIDGCIRTLAISIDTFMLTPGFLPLIKKLWKFCSNVQDYRNAKGIMNEARVALVLQRMGYGILQFGMIFKGREYDIVTTDHLVECKNINWKKYPKRGMKKLHNQAKHGVMNAQILNKEYLWATKYPLPARTNVLQSDLISSGARIVQC